MCTFAFASKQHALLVQQLGCKRRLHRSHTLQHTQHVLLAATARGLL
jgi:hypothetical protein